MEPFSTLKPPMCEISAASLSALNRKTDKTGAGNRLPDVARLMTKATHASTAQKSGLPF